MWRCDDNTYPFSYSSRIIFSLNSDASLGEMWIGVCLSVVVELVPEKLRITGVGVYFFIITNIGGNMQVLVPPVVKAFKSSFELQDVDALRRALYIFYPGEYVMGSVLFLLTLLVLKRDLNRLKQVSENNDLVEKSGDELNNNARVSLAELNGEKGDTSKFWSIRWEIKLSLFVVCFFNLLLFFV